MHPFFRVCTVIGVAAVCTYALYTHGIKTMNQNIDDKLLNTIKDMAKTDENPIELIRALSNEGLTRLSQISSSLLLDDVKYWYNVKLTICVETVLRTNNQEAQYA